MHLKSVFYQFGPPKILQTDREEFVGHELQELLQEFPKTRHVRKRARHPESKGVIERATQTLELKIGSFLLENRATRSEGQQT